jgi:hypothetical protein
LSWIEGECEDLAECGLFVFLQVDSHCEGGLGTSLKPRNQECFLITSLYQRLER